MPFLNTSIISQKINDRVLSKKCAEIFSLLDSPNVHLKNKYHYITLTHDKFINSISKLNIIDYNKKYIKLNAGSMNLKYIQKNLLNNRCKLCPNANKCKYIRAGRIKHEFYFLSFHTK